MEELKQEYHTEYYESTNVLYYKTSQIQKNGHQNLQQPKAELGVDTQEVLQLPQDYQRERFPLSGRV